MSDKNWFIELVSYIAFVLMALCLLLSAFGLGVGVLDRIANLLAAIGLVFQAYRFTRRYTRTRNGLVWVIIFWVAVIIFVLAFILPFTGWFK